MNTTVFFEMQTYSDDEVLLHVNSIEMKRLLDKKTIGWQEVFEDFCNSCDLYKMLRKGITWTQMIRKSSEMIRKSLRMNRKVG